MEESGKRKATTTSRRLNSGMKERSVQETRMNMGRVKGGRGTGINEQSMTHTPGGKRKTWNSNSANTAVVIANATENCQKSCISDSNSDQSTSSKIGIRSPTQVLKKTRSEPLRVSSSNEIELRTVNSLNQSTAAQSNQHDQLPILGFLLDNVNNNSDKSQDEDVTTEDEHVDRALDFVEDPETRDQGSGGNKIDKVSITPSATECNNNEALPELIPSSHPSTSTSTCCKPLSSGSSTDKPALPTTPTPTTARDASNEYDTSTTPETHTKLQTLVDLVMWRDVAKSAFIFGFGTFIIISSSYAKDFNFSLISVGSYLSLVYLVVVFFYKSFMSRGVMDREDWWPENYVWGEEEAIWFVKLVLPYLNEFLVNLRGMFSGDPGITMKLAVMLFVLARCGSSITIWKMLKLGFFGVFVIPKLSSSYSTQITAHAKFWVGRFQDAWESCSQKKAVAFVIFAVVWNFSSVVARAWAAFMLFVAFRYYQQSLITDDFDQAVKQTALHNNVQKRRHLARNRCGIPNSLDQKKQKKGF